jgi:hypothetical protein
MSREIKPSMFSIALLGSLATVIACSLAGTANATTGNADPTPGAKELFYDPVGRDVTSSSPAGARTEIQHTVKTRSTVKIRETVVSPPAAAPLPVDAQGRRLVALPAAGAPRPMGSLGLSYWIELETPGSTGVQVTERRTFRSGERIRLHFRSNADGHISILQLGASGTAQQLFPNAENGLVDSALAANEERILPSAAHWFRFDDRPGQERLIVVFARNQGELDDRPLRQRLDPIDTEGLLRVASHVRGSKDLVIETEVSNAAEIGTYGVNVAGQPVVLEIVLDHQ